MEILISILSGGAGVAVIEGVREAISWRRNRKASREDKAEEKQEYEQRHPTLKRKQGCCPLKRKWTRRTKP